MSKTNMVKRDIPKIPIAPSSRKSGKENVENPYNNMAPSGA
jgi:hypothetical protein